MSKHSDKILLSVAEYTCMDNDSQGICLECGAIADGVEPDACKYECDECGENQVYGVAELLMMGEIEITDDCDETVDE